MWGNQQIHLVHNGGNEEGRGRFLKRKCKKRRWTRPKFKSSQIKQKSKILNRRLIFPKNNEIDIILIQIHIKIFDFTSKIFLLSNSIKTVLNNPKLIQCVQQIFLETLLESLRSISRLLIDISSIRLFHQNSKFQNRN
jgi:hypothetical protein